MMEDKIRFEWTLDGLANFFNKVEKDTHGNAGYTHDYWRGFHSAVRSIIGRDNFIKVVERADELLYKNK